METLQSLSDTSRKTKLNEEFTYEETPARHSEDTERHVVMLYLFV